MNKHQNYHCQCRQRRKTLMIFAACFCLLLALQGVVVVLLIERNGTESRIAHPPDDCRKLFNDLARITRDCQAINFSKPYFERV